MAVKDVMEALRDVVIENSRLSELVKDIRLVGKTLEIVYRLPRKGVEEHMVEKTKEALERVPEVDEVRVRFVEEAPAQPVMGAPMFTRRRVPGIRHLICVGSGKGGVGKSTVSANLALALSKLGYRVGLLDADMYGPSIPTLMGIKGERVSVDSTNRMIPIEKYGLKLLSMGFLLPSEDTPVIWRGPMLMRALTQFLFDANWGELDYLVMDLPPGTGDVQLTLAQNVHITGAVVVTTPQDVALADVKKAVAMFREVQIPVLGLIENMAYFVCPGSGEKFYIFGKGRVMEFATTYRLKVLGSIPIDPELAETSDLGKPVVEKSPDSDTARAFVSIAKLVSDMVERR
ncbi:MAG: Mrp/NBP35 family ATP-binding protein [Aquificaceae bacterium]|nr:Mrp/NBP35 family ATP-binding protein [Aquificaceae bacterium]MCX8059771.1 Mrp/NBP35 family ATP-binding protein [Aquificaceae bacterium]MDW8097093.1 Mrp/NBP35 family ATP-binding protein [Aquificaceae bacterium]